MRRLGTVDLDTGEVLDGVHVATFQPRLKVKEKYMLLFQKALQDLATDRQLRGESLRVLLALLGRLDFENYLNISQRELADELRVRQPSIARAMRQLRERGIVLEGPASEGNRRTYRLSSSLGWKGRVRSLEEARRRKLKPSGE